MSGRSSHYAKVGDKDIGDSWQPLNEKAGDGFLSLTLGIMENKQPSPRILMVILADNESSLVFEVGRRGHRSESSSGMTAVCPARG